MDLFQIAKFGYHLESQNLTNALQECATLFLHKQVTFSLLILWLTSRSARGASHHPAFMGNCLTISHTFFNLIYPVDKFALKEMRMWDQSKILSCFFVWCESSLLLQLKSHSMRGASHHLAFMGNCPTVSYTFFALPTQWMSSASTE